MERKAVSNIILTLLLIGMLASALGILPIEASGIVYIRPNGSIEGTDKIQQNGDVYTLTGNIYDEIVIERDNIMVDGAGYKVQGTGVETGIDLSGRNNVTIKNMEIKSFHNAILLQGSSKNNMVGNTLIDNTERGIMLSDSSENSIYRNNLTTNNWGGICLYLSSNNSILRNNVINSGPGIYLHGSSNNNISRNSIAKSDSPAVYFEDSSNNTISENNITANDYDGIMLDMSSNNGISRNYITANNRFGIYLYRSSNSNTHGNNITNNYNGIYFESSSINTISGNNIVTNRVGIRLYDSSRNSISGNNIANNTEGISLNNCSNSVIGENNITNSLWHGIGLEFSDDNNLVRNNITHTYYWCIEMHYSDSNTIAGNNLVDTINGSAILVGDSRINKICHNNFINNNISQAFVYGSYRTAWDDNYPSGGNYWSDYEERYPYAKELDDSGIWDTPYVIDENNQDNYPLMGPWTPPPPIPRTINELKTKIEEFGSEDEIDNRGIVRSLIAKLNVAQKLVGKGKIDEAKSILEDDFIPQVQNLTRIHITVEAADILIKHARAIHRASFQFPSGS